MTRVFIGLGSNLEAPRRQVETALVALEQLPQSRLIGRSPLYRSKPVGPQDQPDFVNAVALLDTDLEALALLDQLQAIEQQHHRQRDGQRWGARTLDLDILLYGNEQIHNARLTVPHPEIPNRGFVLKPLHDLAPELNVPGQGAVSELLARVATDDLEKLADAE